MVKRKNRKWLILLVITLVLMIAILVFLQLTMVKQVEIVGNEQYTEDEIRDMIFDTPYAQNSFYLMWKYNHNEDYEIPFIDTIEIETLSSNKIRINIYEKNMVGCIDYLGSYMYFDKDGIIVESSKELVEGVPLISGLKFEYIILNKKLAVEDDSIFNTILNVTQSLDKHMIKPSKIYFNSSYEMTLYFEQAKVYMGKDENTEEKIIKLKGIVPKLEGLNGILHMEEYDESTKSITFETEKD